MRRSPLRCSVSPEAQHERGARGILVQNEWRACVGVSAEATRGVNDRGPMSITSAVLRVASQRVTTGSSIDVRAKREGGPSMIVERGKLVGLVSGVAVVLAIVVPQSAGAALTFAGAAQGGAASARNSVSNGSSRCSRSPVNGAWR